MMDQSSSIQVMRILTHGVAIILSKEKAKSLLEWEPVRERLRSFSHNNVLGRSNGLLGPNTARLGLSEHATRTRGRPNSATLGPAGEGSLGAAWVDLECGASDV